MIFLLYVISTYFCDALTLEYIFRHGELPLFVLLVALICFHPWMHCSRMESPEHYKPLSWKVALDGSGVFGNGHHIVLQRWTLFIFQSMLSVIFDVVPCMLNNWSALFYKFAAFPHSLVIDGTISENCWTRWWPLWDGCICFTVQ